MASQFKQSFEPVGINRLLELLNEAEGIADRGPRPSADPVAEEAEAPPPHPSEAETNEAPEPRVEQIPAEIQSIETADDLENRFAAHIVRGMSKSKNG